MFLSQFQRGRTGGREVQVLGLDRDQSNRRREGPNSRWRDQPVQNPDGGRSLEKLPANEAKLQIVQRCQKMS